MHRGNHRIAAPSRSHHSIKEWPEGDRPREKLLRHGPATLSEAELLAVLFRSGKRGATALDLAKGVLATMGPLRDLARLTVSDFVHAGLGPVRAATLVAVFELARRIPSGDGTVRPFFRSPEDVSARYLSRLKDLNHEEFWVLLLTSANQLIREVRVTSGTLNSSLVHPRECFSEAIKHKAAGVIFLHNHPSGNAEPSQEDIAITRQLVEAGKILGIPVHDHLILAGADCTSLAGRGLM